MTWLEIAESRMHEIHELFCTPDYFTRTPSTEVGELKEEQNTLQSELTDLMTEWEAIENEAAALEDLVDHTR